VTSSLRLLLLFFLPQDAQAPTKKELMIQSTSLQASTLFYPLLSLSLSTLFFQCLVCFTLQFGSFKICFYYSYLTWLEVRTVGCSSKGVVRLSLSLSLSLWSGCFERLDPLYANTAFESDPPLQLFLCSPSLYCFAQKEQHHLPPHLFLIGFLIHGILTPCIFFYIFFPKLCFSRFVVLLFLFLNIIYVAMCFLNYL